MTYYDDPLVTLLHGDCVEVMATLPADSVDAVVTDPPYGLEFMGKEWDRLGDVGRITHSGIPADERKIMFAGRPAYNGSSNVRCRNCGKWKWGHKIGDGGGGGKACECNAPDFPDLSHRQAQLMQEWHGKWATEALRVTKPGGYLLAFGGTRTHHRLVCALEDAGWIIRDELDWIYASGFPKGKANLKPAHEPIVLARKPGPLRPLAIDESRIPNAEGDDFEKAWDKPVNVSMHGPVGHLVGPERKTVDLSATRPAGGRWPSNVLLSDPELFDEPNPYVVGAGDASVTGVRHTESSQGAFFGSGERVNLNGFWTGERGGYSRFFIVPKADRAERERGLADAPSFSGADPMAGHRGRRMEGDVNVRPDGKVSGPRANVHPTVKPIDLMRHLVRLVTPSGGVVLDPFLGSGTTCLAASELGLKSIGIEREAEYLEIAKGRLIATPMGLGLDAELVGEPRVSRDGVAVRHNSGGNTFGGDKPKPPMADMTYGAVREPRPTIINPTAPMFDEEPV